MKAVVIVFLLFFCNHTFAQQINSDDVKLPPLILLKYPNIKDAFTTKNSTLPLLEIKGKKNINLFIDTSKRANRNFIFSQSKQINLNKELLKIMHRFPGDGSNLVLSPKGLIP